MNRKTESKEKSKIFLRGGEKREFLRKTREKFLRVERLAMGKIEFLRVGKRGKGRIAKGYLGTQGTSHDK